VTVVPPTGQAPSFPLPLSQGTRAGGLVFVSGQVGVDPVTRELVPGGIDSQTRRALLNVQAILAAAGATLADVVKVTAWIVRAEDFPAFNAIYGEFFPSHPPARSAVRSDLVLAGALVEIEAIAEVDNP
jgi:2-iminobutanoate/2-iminopropanoate deaminase